MPTDYLTTDTELTSIANAIRTKGGTSAALEYPADFITAINAISGGGGGGDDADEKDVNFIDYDGKILYSYTAAEFANLSAMPANPSRDGLTAQGWNWTLADAKTYVASYGCLVIGQMYVTDDGKTRFYFSIPDGWSYKTITIRFTQSKANGVTFNWGDGSATETFSSTIAQNVTHTYSAAGDYVVTLAPASDCNLQFQGSSTKTILGSTNSARRIAKYLKKIEFGARVTSITYGFPNFWDVKSISFPNTVTNLTNSFALNSMKAIVLPSSLTNLSRVEYLYSLRYISFPKYIATIDASCLLTAAYDLRMLCLPVQAVSYVCNSLNSAKVVTIPEGTTTVGSGFCNGFYGRTITFPSTMTNMNSANILANAVCIEEIHMKSKTPPTLGSYFLHNASTDYTIYVPYSDDHSVLNNYKAASNWSSKASYIVEEPQ